MAPAQKAGCLHGWPLAIPPAGADPCGWAPAHEDKGLLVGRQLEALQQRRLVSAKMGEHPVAQPIHDGVLRPQAMQLWPSLFFSSGLTGSSMAVAMRCGLAQSE